MKTNNLYILLIFTVLFTFTNCKENPKKDKHHDHGQENHEDKHSSDHGTEEHHEELTLTQEQMDALQIKVGKIAQHNMGQVIEVNGRLKVPPQGRAAVTTVIGANISSIEVIDGDKVHKGQILGYVKHPSIVKLQTDYLKTYHELSFLEKDYERNKKLYEAKVGSGKEYQKAKSAFLTAKALEKGYQNQLSLLGLSVKSVRLGNISSSAPIKSPIDGFIEKINIKLGQYVNPQTSLFEIVNVHHVHLDLSVFEKDIHKVKKGQLVNFKVKSLGDKKFTARIFAVGKVFEKDPKTLHVHAEMNSKDPNLLAGMYVTAQIVLENSLKPALPQKAIFQQDDDYYIFTAQKKTDNIWEFSPERVLIKSVNNGYAQIVFKDDSIKNSLIAKSGAYYLMAELKKSQAGHSH